MSDAEFAYPSWQSQWFGDYQLGREIGGGPFGRVFEARYRGTGAL